MKSGPIALCVILASQAGAIDLGEVKGVALDGRGTRLQDKMKKMEEVLDDRGKQMEGHKRYDVDIAGVRLSLFSDLNPEKLAEYIRANGEKIFRNNGLEGRLTPEQIKELKEGVISLTLSEANPAGESGASDKKGRNVPTQLSTPQPPLSEGESQLSNKGISAENRIHTHIGNKSSGTHLPATQSTAHGNSQTKLKIQHTQVPLANKIGVLPSKTELGDGAMAGSDGDSLGFGDGGEPGPNQYPEPNEPEGENLDRPIQQN